MPHNIEKSAFKRGEYVGYGQGLVWRIKNTNSTRAPYWTAVANSGAGHFKIISAPTLRELSAKLEKGARSPGQVAYEEDVLREPKYHDGSPRRAWSHLGEIERESWEHNPTVRAKVQP